MANTRSRKKQPQTGKVIESKGMNAKDKARIKAEQRRKASIGSNVFGVFLVIYFAAYGYCWMGPPANYVTFKHYAWEKRWSGKDLQEFWASWDLMLPVWLGIAYLVATFGGLFWMRNRPRYELKWTQRFCNFGLAVFSIWFSLRSAQSAKSYNGFDSRDPRSFRQVVCGDTERPKEWGPQEEGVPSQYFFYPEIGWTALVFITSKYFEYIDTFFLVARKKPVIVLHWWHHFSVSIVSMYVGKMQYLGGWYYLLMNFFVHSCMYTYYTFAAFGYRPTAWAYYITLLQIGQMVLGTWVTLKTYYEYKMVDGPCEPFGPDVPDLPLIEMACLMYISYFVLFTKLFVERYYGAPAPKKKTK